MNVLREQYGSALGGAEGFCELRPAGFVVKGAQIKQSNDMENISTITKVDLTAAAGGRYTIHAVGTVPTAGWSRPALVSRGAIIDSNGNLDYDFMAERPPGRPIQVISEVRAEAQIGGPGTSLQGLRVIRVFDRNGRSFKCSFRPR